MNVYREKALSLLRYFLDLFQTIFFFNIFDLCLPACEKNELKDVARNKKIVTTELNIRIPISRYCHKRESVVFLSP